MNAQNELALSFIGRLTENEGSFSCILPGIPTFPEINRVNSGRFFD